MADKSQEITKEESDLVNGCSKKAFFPRSNSVDNPHPAGGQWFNVNCSDSVKLMCWRRDRPRSKYSCVHFHGNGELVESYVREVHDDETAENSTERILGIGAILLKRMSLVRKPGLLHHLPANLFGRLGPCRVSRIWWLHWKDFIQGATWRL